MLIGALIATLALTALAAIGGMLWYRARFGALRDALEAFESAHAQPERASARSRAGDASDARPSIPSLGTLEERIGRVRGLLESDVRRVSRLVQIHHEHLRALAAVAQNRDQARELRMEADVYAEASAVLARRQDAILEMIPDGVAVTNGQGALVRINAAGREIVGLRQGAHEAEDALTDVTDPLLQALREGTTISGLEVAISSPTGPRIIQVKVSKLVEDDSSRAAVALFRDVTHELLLEHELRSKGHELEQHVEALERATRLKSEFLANMSHELRTPLNAVIGFTEVLLEGTYGALNPKQRECADDVVAAGRHLLALINDILDLSKIEAGRMDLAVDDLDVAEVAAQAIKLLRPHAAAKHVRVDHELVPGLFFVRADLDRLRQVLVNLLSNAVKFTPNGGQVHVSASIVGNFARIAVSDTGIGIADADRDKLFREFSQIDGSVTRKFGGTGLGLAICRRIVEMHGGRIDLTSKVGEGSTFWIEIPLSPRLSSPTFIPGSLHLRAAPALMSLATRAPATVLVLDEDPASQRLVESALDDAGIRAVCAGSLSEARELARSMAIEVVVVDPIVSHAEIEDVNAFVQARFGPRVVVSSLATLREATRGLSSATFVAKPVVRANLVEQVRRVSQEVVRRRALVVEPNDDDARAVTKLLEREGFEVHVARTLAEARATQAREVALAILELDLPDGDGAPLVEELAAAGAPVVVLTERELDARALASLERRARLVIKKGTLSRAAFARQLTSVCTAAAPTRTRVLAVDDNEQNLRLITTVLSSRGYDIVEARDAMSALQMARTTAPDVILMDVMLPDLDGLAATRQLKSEEATRGIPVIAVTAQAMAGDAERASEAGCSDYVPKPIDTVRLVSAIERVIARPA